MGASPDGHAAAGRRSWEAMISVLVVDDHPAVRTGLVGLLAAEPGFEAVGAADGHDSALAEARRCQPDVALVDYHLPPRDGLELSLALKVGPDPPRVVIYSAFADEGLTPAAVVALADGLVDKNAQVGELFEALRRVVGGERALRAPRPELMRIAAGRLDAEDLPILGMLMEGTPLADVRSVLGVPDDQLVPRLSAVAGRLRTRPGH
jgi:DNA-binding NarL/FixJ family response regulator